MSAHSSSGPAVLVVDDDFVLLDIVSALFERAGLKVYTASSGEAALTLLRDHGHAIDWLFTDINLPGLVDGCSVADEYRVLYPTRPIIYASSNPRRDQPIVSGSIYVEKPFQPAEIQRIAEMMRFATSAMVRSGTRHHNAEYLSP